MMGREAIENPDSYLLSWKDKINDDLKSALSGEGKEEDNNEEKGKIKE